MTNQTHEITVTHHEANQRLDHFLTNKFAQFTRSYLQHLINRGLVHVNGRQVKTGFNLSCDEIIHINVPEAKPSPILPEDLPLDIIFDDPDVMVLNKPAGMVVHPGAGNRSGTLVNALLFHCTSLSGINGVLRPGIVHRLDKNTSGLLVVAKNDRSHHFLSAQFETREIIRMYKAIVWGIPAEASGVIETNIDRSHRDRKKMSVSEIRGRPAITRYEIEQEFNGFSLLRITLGTGRTHQIRVHLNHIHHPVFGDREYNGGTSQLNRIVAHRRKYVAGVLKKLPRQALHACELSFIHPNSKERMSFTVPMAEDIKNALHALKNV